MSQYHTPVLLEESVGLLAVEPAGTYADLTFGGGGHSRRILSALGPEGRLYGFDQDRDTLENRPDDARFHYVESNFRFLRGALRLRGVTEVDGILARPGGFVAPFRRRGARILVPRRGSARHAHEPEGAAHGGRRGERLHRGGPDPHSGRLGRGRNTVEGCQLSGQGPCGGARDDHGAAGRSREALHAQKGRGEIPDQTFPGPAHRGQRRDGGVENGAGAEPAGAEARRPAGRYLLPFARRQAGEEFHAQRQLLGAGRKGLFRSFAGPVRPRDAQGRDPFGRRTRPQSPFPFGETPGGRKTLIRCTETTNSTR